jgi:molybdate transport repressor ModE-like protein/molybdopterin-binding protein
VRRADVVTSTDVALLRAIARERSVVAASRRLGLSRDRGVYRLERLARAFGGPVVASVRGGASYGGSALTTLGDRILRGGFGSLELLAARPTVPLSTPNRLHGVYRRAPGPEVVVGRSLRLRVAFPADDGATVGLVVDPEAIVVARRRFASSARNVLAATVEAVRRGRDDLDLTLVVRTAGARFRVAVTEGAVRQLRLAPGTPVWLYVKATALRPVAASSQRRR